MGIFTTLNLTLILFFTFQIIESLGQPSISEEVGEEDNINQQIVPQGITLALINYISTLCGAKKN